ncbi:hypothetical protein KY334_01865 [Candidatus Woesearchaeota archaeon]|nr:hypothetical protein [Candidatus Woesearchaeota archaeon]
MITNKTGFTIGILIILYEIILITSSFFDPLVNGVVTSDDIMFILMGVAFISLSMVCDKKAAKKTSKKK